MGATPILILRIGFPHLLQPGKTQHRYLATTLFFNPFHLPTSFFSLIALGKLFDARAQTQTRHSKTRKFTQKLLNLSVYNFVVLDVETISLQTMDTLKRFSSCNIPHISFYPHFQDSPCRTLFSEAAVQRCRQRIAKLMVFYTSSFELVIHKNIV